MISLLRPPNTRHFFDFVPGSIRAQFGDELAVPLVSTSIFAEHKRLLSGPTLEVTWPGAAALAGVMRAVQRHDAILAVVAPAAISMNHDAAIQWVDAILAVAESVHFKQPLSIVGRVEREHATGIRDANWSQSFSEKLYAEIEAGFTAIAFQPRNFGLEGASEIATLTAPLQELGIGIEVEFNEGDPAAIYLAQLEDAGLPISAVRGATTFDDTLGLHVVDPLQEELPEDAAMRVSVDGFVLKAFERILSNRERLALHADIVAFGAHEAVSARLPFFAELSDDERERFEAFADMHIDAAIPSLCADGVASAFLDALDESE